MATDAGGVASAEERGAGLRARAASYRAAATRLAARAAPSVALAAILAFGLALRTTNLNWDDGQHLHPDERFLSSVAAEVRPPGSVGEYFDSAHSSYNPYNIKPSYVYGTMPLFVTKAAAEWMDRDADGSSNRTGAWARSALIKAGFELKNPDGTLAFDGRYNSNLIGRILSALMDTATIALVFALGRRLFTTGAGLAGALLFAAAPLQIQYSHFFGMDTWLTFFATSSLYASVRVAQGGNWRWWLLAGFTLGLALACKVSGIFTAAPLIIAAAAVGIRAIRYAPPPAEDSEDVFPPRVRAAFPAVAMLGVAAVLALAVFRVAQPYAFTGPGLLSIFHWDLARSDLGLSAMLHLRPLYPTHYLKFDPRFTHDLSALHTLQEGADYPPNVQWIGRTAYVFPLRNMAFWGFGPCASLLALVGLVRVGFEVRAERRYAALLLVAWMAIVTGYYGREFAATMRYFMPVLPAVAVVAGAGVAWPWAAARAIRLPAFRRPWIPQRDLRPVLRGATVAGVSGAVLFGLAFTHGVYGREISRIAASRWMLREIPPGSIISHQNWDDGLPMQPPGFPPNPFVTQDLDLYGTGTREEVVRLAEQLDRLQYVVESSNRIYGSIPRHPARYPAVTRYYAALEDGSLGFEKVAEFTNRPALFGVELNDDNAEEAFTVYDHPKVTIWWKTPAFSLDNTLRILDPDAQDARVYAPPGAAATNSLQLTPERYAAQQSGGTWRTAFASRAAIDAAPWFWWLAWFELLALAALPATIWLCGALPDRGYGLSKVLAFATTTAVTWALVARGVADFSGGLAVGVFVTAMIAGAASWWTLRRQVAQLWREHRRQWLTTEAVFLGTFLFFLALRLWNPATWYHPTGGEKPMELSYLTAVSRSSLMPPYDPWFAGGYLNYYYMGWFALAVPMRALHIVPEVAFNLAVPLFASMAAVTAYTTAFNLAALSRQSRPAAANSARGHGWPVAAGLAAAFLLVFAGNFDGVHQSVERLQSISDTGLLGGVPVAGGAISLGAGIIKFVGGANLPPYDWWRSSRVHFGSSDITEFPYWTLLFADLHPHLMDFPFFGLVAALAVTYLASCKANLRAQGWGLAAALGATAGFIRTVHTWDFPAALLLTLAAIALGQLIAQRPRRDRAITGVAQAVLAVATGWLLFAPYLRDAEVFNQGIVHAPATTPPQQFFVQFGPFIVIGLAYLFVRYAEERAAGSANPVVRLLAAPLPLAFAASAVLVVIVMAASRDDTTAALAFLGVLLLMNLLVFELRAGTPDIGRLAATAAMAAGFAIAGGIELVTVKDDIGRMNTVFKFSLQAWQLMALSCGYAAWYVLRASWEAASTFRLSVPERVALLLPAACGFALLGSCVFLFSGTPARQDARFPSDVPTLNGLRYMDNSPVFVLPKGNPLPVEDTPLQLKDDLPVIDWLRDNVNGSPTIVEGVGPSYYWAGRISMYTGLPAVIGWDFHQVQQRGTLSQTVNERRKQTALFYSGTDRAEAEHFLRRYDVSYVVLGGYETAVSTAASRATIASIPALAEAFRSGDYVIYRVDKAALGSAVAIDFKGKK